MDVFIKYFSIDDFFLSFFQPEEENLEIESFSEHTE
jgi:hypothetical protein